MVIKRDLIDQLLHKTELEEDRATMLSFRLREGAAGAAGSKSFPQATRGCARLLPLYVTTRPGAIDADVFSNLPMMRLPIACSINAAT